MSCNIVQTCRDYFESIFMMMLEFWIIKKNMFSYMINICWIIWMDWSYFWTLWVVLGAIFLQYVHDLLEYFGRSGLVG